MNSNKLRAAIKYEIYFNEIIYIKKHDACTFKWFTEGKLDTVMTAMQKATMKAMVDDFPEYSKLWLVGR